MEQLRQPVVTSSNIILRGLTKEQEKRFLILEKKVMEGRKASWRWTPPGKGIAGIAGGMAGHGGRYGAEGELSDVSSWWKDANRIGARSGPGDRERLTSAIAAAVGLADQALSAQGFSASVGLEHGRNHHHTHGGQSGYHHHHQHNHDHGHGHNTHHGHFSGDEDVGDDISVLVGGENELSAGYAGYAGTASTESRISFDEALNRLSSIFPQVLPPFTAGEYKVSVDFTGPCGGIGCQAARGDVEGLERVGVGMGMGMGMGVEGEYEFVVGEGEAVGGTITLSAGLAPPGTMGQGPELTISSSGVTASAGKGKGKAKANGGGHGDGTVSPANPVPGHLNTTTVNVPIPANLASTMNGVISGMMSGLGLPGFAAATGGLSGLGGLGGAMGMLGVPGPAGFSTPIGAEGVGGVSGAQGIVAVSVEEAEKQLVAKRKETEGLERRLNQLLKRNRRLAGL